MLAIVDEAPLPVFVYGTLRPGRVNWPVAERFCRRHEPAMLPGFALYDLDYPCAVGAAPPIAGDGGRPAVRGDLLWLDDVATDALLHLDAFEGYDPQHP